MIDLGEAQKLWLSSQPIDGVTFGLNDTVRIKSGVHADQFGSVIFIISLQPNPVYLVELGIDGSEVEILQSELESA